MGVVLTRHSGLAEFPLKDLTGDWRRDEGRIRVDSPGTSSLSRVSTVPFVGKEGVSHLQEIRVKPDE